MNESSKKRRRAREALELANNDARGLGRLLARAREIQALDNSLATLLSDSMAPHVRVLNVRDGKLIIATPVAPIATRLRMESSHILKNMQTAHPGLFHDLEISITPTLPPRGT